MKTHTLKTWSEHFAAVVKCEKTCEVRNADRGFKVGDMLHLKEWTACERSYTGRSCWVRVTHVLAGGECGIEPGYVVLSIYRPMMMRLEGRASC